MKLVGPWLSGFTRRTGITMKLLGIPFQHLNLNAYTEKEEVRRYSPMGKVPALVQAAIEGFAEQAIIGLKLLEAEVGDGWLVNDKLSQADIMAVVCYQGASMLVLRDHVTAKSFPHLAALTARAMKIEAFASTAPSL